MKIIHGLTEQHWPNLGFAETRYHTVYFGYLTDRQKHQLQQICDRAKRRSLTLHEYNIEILAEESFSQ